jgi:glyoxylase-like metal-dependent hydrolase (beta-lactamase superfamily II)
MRGLAVGAVVSLSLQGCAPAALEGPISPPQIVEGSFTAGRQPDGNSVIFEDETGLVVVDTGRHLEHQAKILALADQAGKPIRAIVNTHWHLDHSGGNAELRARHPKARLHTSNAIVGALERFLARSLVGARARLEDPKLTEAEKAEVRLGVDAIEDRGNLLPDVAVTGSTSLPLGDRALELHLAPRAVTEGDVWIWDSATKTLVAGDLVVLPAPFFDTACAEGWRRALAVISEMPFETLIPGHGPPMSREEFDVYRTAFDRLVDCAGSVRRKSECVTGWQRDAAKLLATEQDRTDAQMLLDYYVDAILRSSEKTAEFCGA